MIEYACDIINPNCIVRSCCSDICQDVRDCINTKVVQCNVVKLIKYNTYILKHKVCPFCGRDDVECSDDDFRNATQKGLAKCTFCNVIFEFKHDDNLHLSDITWFTISSFFVFQNLTFKEFIERSYKELT